MVPIADRRNRGHRKRTDPHGRRLAGEEDIADCKRFRARTDELFRQRTGRLPTARGSSMRGPGPAKWLAEETGVPLNHWRRHRRLGKYAKRPSPLHWAWLHAEERCEQLKAEIAGRDEEIKRLQDMLNKRVEERLARLEGRHH